MYKSGDTWLKGRQNISRNEVLAAYDTRPEYMNMHMHMLMIMYGLNDKISIMGMLGYQYMNMGMNMKHVIHHQGQDHLHYMNSQGLSDLQLTGMAKLWQGITQTLTMHAGFMLPTGNIDNKSRAGGSLNGAALLPYQMQPGNGHCSFIVGATYNSFFERSSFGMQLSTNQAMGNNKFGYHMGKEWQAHVWSLLKVCRFFDFSARAEGVYTGAIQGVNRLLESHSEPSADTRNYGGTSLTVYPGFRMGNAKGPLTFFSFAMEYSIPLLNMRNGIQLDLNRQALISIDYHF